MLMSQMTFDAGKSQFLRNELERSMKLLLVHGRAVEVYATVGGIGSA